MHTPLTGEEAAALRQSLLRVWRTPILNTVLNASARWAPRRVRQYVEQERLAARLRDRRRAVPEADYRALLGRGVRELAARSGAAPLGDYLEFGVYNGTSLIAAYREIDDAGCSDVRLFGFDSFEGLPAGAATEDDQTWRPGAWRSDLAFTEAVLAAERVDRRRVTLIPGWFSATCTADTRVRHDMRKASLIMVDCDLYSSTKQALDFCAPLVTDTALLMFDDWHSGNLAAKNLGERRAFEEWLLEQACFRAEPFGSYSSRSETFLVTRAQ
jgi:hypothetical protein